MFIIYNFISLILAILAVGGSFLFFKFIGKMKKDIDSLKK